MKTQRMAGLKALHDEHGPDMPMDARYLVRLPLKVLRRVIPQPDGWQHAINALEDVAPPSEQQKWVLHEVLPGNQAVFQLVDASFYTKIECDDCDGNGYFHHGNHEYECRECEGEGSLQNQVDTPINNAIVSIDGRIIESPTVH